MNKHFKTVMSKKSTDKTLIYDVVYNLSRVLLLARTNQNDDSSKNVTSK